MRRPERCDDGQASLATPGVRAGGREAQGGPPLASSHVTPCDTDVTLKGGVGGWEGPTQGCSSLPPLVAERWTRRSPVTEFLEIGGGGGGGGEGRSQRRGRGAEIPERREELRSQRGGGVGGWGE